ncbi:MAG: SH3 domain-containing protein [Lachnospiraceae bacterium]|nr:SH3 domain-containing protein [Lachnospiraceae bacterium]
MNTSNNNIHDFIKAKLEIVKNWLFRYSRIIMPIVLVICVGITVAVAINANKRKTTEEETVEATEDVNITGTLIAVPEVPLKQDEVPEINELFNTYYNAMVEGDTDTLSRLMSKLDETAVIRTQETSKFVESYPALEVYTKTGPKENTYIAYVYTEVKFRDYEKPIPGLSVHYVCMDENGNYYINDDGEDDASILNYIREINLQEDVIDLNNKVNVAYNDMLAEDEGLSEFIVDLKIEIDKNVGEALARAGGSENPEQSGEPEDEEQPDETVDAGEADESEPAVVVTKVKATDVVNIRSSDSETADKLGKAAIGDEFTLLEERGNGWSKISYEGRDAFIKSEYLEPSEVTQADEGDADTGSDTQAGGNDSNATTGTVTVKENVRIRASASENGEKLGTAYVGEELELIMKQADGWTKIKYNGQTAYVKSEYVE